ncbi:hypothetical protein F1D05_28080 [Kribbella qitaiheensis]|uniref:NADH-ubiquinone oxidoreductase 51kDa subunit FMN-binding domain-containing protein n=1 Tax=Kribbella qitaiheensis TaxID=1544730 RepID=A0A7G6XAD1_9ACTN|nr:hypothetical protein F1D05_28080 [Kribbella qitaiheensis]
MHPALALQENPPLLRSIGPPRLLAGLKEGRADLQHHLWAHGAQPQLTREAYGELATAVGLRGRGGAGFPVALKLADLPAKGIEAVVVNGSESEPLSRKDRLLLTLAPHLVLDGAAGLAKALHAREVLVAVHNAEAAASLRAAIHERQDSVEIQVSDTPGRFVAGEARASPEHPGRWSGRASWPQSATDEEGLSPTPYLPVERRDLRPARSTGPARVPRVQQHRPHQRAGHPAPDRRRRGPATRSYRDADRSAIGDHSPVRRGARRGTGPDRRVPRPVIAEGGWHQTESPRGRTGSRNRRSARIRHLPTR